MAVTSGASHMLQWAQQRAAIPRGGANPKNTPPVQITVCNSTV
eukprot:CAMPEP_0198709682 /NCGR_PEP_ID=MMETSP1471-20131121/2004_1 /TAXON_ID=41880 /ORGANISM="Pycnococcus provasolii, Strain RCC733" /LENGTH=42 /DNA_ID= /DNA_START= /DNA_END= /DNA_ORIENTATION=